MQPDYDVIIVGGGLAGLVSAIELAARNHRVLLLEKNQYPFNKVCGEYVSMEVLPYLQRLGFDPFGYDASVIKKLRISTPKGNSIYTRLDRGGFGLSRYVMDNALASLAVEKGAELKTAVNVTDIQFSEHGFTVYTSAYSYTAKVVIGSYGKRSMLDRRLNRTFINNHTGYMGVKYHIKTAYPEDEIGLDNFKNGYCGIVKIEADKYNLCYLYKRGKGESVAGIQQLEEEVLFRNPVIKRLFEGASFIDAKPLVINQVCFAPKTLVENHVLMCGDTAGLITPLCGNGMSMAVGAAKLLTLCINESGILNQKIITLAQRQQLERIYAAHWSNNFSYRLRAGRALQAVFRHPLLTEWAVPAIHAIQPLERRLLRATRGEVIH